MVLLQLANRSPVEVNQAIESLVFLAKSSLAPSTTTTWLGTFSIVIGTICITDGIDRGNNYTVLRVRVEWLSKHLRL